MSLPKSKQYRFDIAAVEKLVAAHGGKQELAFRLRCSERQLHRALRNVSGSARLKRDILAALEVDPGTVGEIVDA